MKWLTNTLHSWGFKVGIYTDAGPVGCSGTNRGSYGHYQQDMNTFAAWGFDAVKVDFCGGDDLRLNPQSAYTAIEDAILHNSSHRPMMLNICVYAQPGQVSSGFPSFSASAFASYRWGYSVGTSWRTDTDVGSPSGITFASVVRNLEADATEPLAAGPGHWNDPDYLGPDLGLTDAQFQTQFSMWAMLAAPLMISDNLSTLSPASMATVSNTAMIAIDQDKLGRQATQVPPADATVTNANGDGEVWLKPLEHGDYAVALLNLSDTTPLTISTSTQAMKIPAAASYKLANVWAGGSSTTSGAISATVQPDSTDVFVVSPG
jgi:alpha-galactosidase